MTEAALTEEAEPKAEDVVPRPKRPPPIPAPEPDCEECKSGAPAWIATFADMATLLMAFFVLILSFAHMNVPKFKNVSGTMNSTFGVQRSVPVVEPPTADNIIAQNYRTAKVEPSLSKTVEEQKTDEPQPDDVELKTDTGQGESSTNADVEVVTKALAREIAEGKVKVTAGRDKVIVEVSSERRAGASGGDISGSPEGQISQENIDLYAKVAAAQARVKSAVQVFDGQAPDQNSGEQAGAQGQQASRQQQLQDQYEQIRANLADEINQGLAEVQRDGDKIIIRLAEKGSFRSGAAELANDFKPLLDKVGASISGTRGLVTIEGHTDNVPVGFSDRFNTNWDLSAARSAAVADYLLDANLVQAGNVNVVGYADTKPVEPNTSAAGRAKNRRIEIILGD